MCKNLKGEALLFLLGVPSRGVINYLNVPLSRSQSYASKYVNNMFGLLGHKQLRSCWPKAARENGLTLWDSQRYIAAKYC